MNFRNVTKAGRSFFLFSLIYLYALSGSGYATFFGSPKTGLQNLGSEKYPYSIYVPEGYTSERSWPLVVALYVAGGSKDKVFIENWAKQAQQHGFILLAPGFNIFMQDNPSAHDRRIKKLIEKMRTQYEIDSGRVLMTGFGDAGHYGLYLGMRFPDEISAVASIGNALDGPLKKMFRFSYAQENRLPILLLVGTQTPADDPVLQGEVEMFKTRGYGVDVVPAATIQSANDPSAIPFILDWFNGIGEKTKSVKRSGLKQKFFRWLDHAISNS